MKKYITWFICVLLFILYVTLFFIILSNKLFEKNNLDKIIDNVNVEKIVKLNNDSIIETEEFQFITKDIIKNKVYSLIFDSNTYTEKEILNLVDNNIDNIILKVDYNFENKDLIRNKIYEECSRINSEPPNVKLLTEKQIDIKNIVNKVLDNQIILVIIICLVTLLLVPINLSSWKWLEYSGIVSTISGIFCFCLLFLLYYVLNTLNTIYIYEFISNIFIMMNNDFLNIIYLFTFIGVFQIILYIIISFIKRKFKRENLTNKLN